MVKVYFTSIVMTTSTASSKAHPVDGIVVTVAAADVSEFMLGPCAIVAFGLAVGTREEDGSTEGVLVVSFELSMVGASVGIDENKSLADWFVLGETEGSTSTG